jgi:hypothetical protein
MALLIITLVRNAERNSLSTAYLRILTNYFQMMTITQSFDLSWGHTFNTFLKGISYFTEGPGIILSVDCFVRDSGYHIEPMYVKLILSCLFPIIGILVAMAAWGLAKLHFKSIFLFENIVISAIVIIYLSVPSIASIVLPLFRCVDYFNDGVLLLTMNLDTVCWEGDHLYYMYRVGFVSIIVWVFGAPCIAYIIMFNNKHRL